MYIHMCMCTDILFNQNTDTQEKMNLKETSEVKRVTFLKSEITVAKSPKLLLKSNTGIETDNEI